MHECAKGVLILNCVVLRSHMLYKLKLVVVWRTQLNRHNICRCMVVSLHFKQISSCNVKFIVVYVEVGDSRIFKSVFVSRLSGKPT